MNFSELEGKRVVLIPLEMKHTQQLFICSRSEKLWEYLPITINTLEEMTDFVRGALVNKHRGEEFPYVVFDRISSQIVGTTRYSKNYVVYSILDEEWRQVKEKLENFINR